MPRWAVAAGQPGATGGGAGVRWFVGDVRDEALMHRVVDGADAPAKARLSWNSWSNTGITPMQAIVANTKTVAEAMGWETFARRCAEVGVDGVLTVDFPPEESHEAFAHLDKHGIDPIFLLAPTSTDARVERVAKQARGYVYYVSLKGVTGAGNLDLHAIEQRIPQLRKHINLPIGVGFGIRDAATALAVAKLCDGVVVGSRIVQEIENSTEQNVVANVSKLVKELRQVVDKA